MTSLALFLKGNKKEKELVKYAVTKSLCDEKGKPLEWTLKPLTTEETEKIREDCTKEVPVKNGQFRMKLDANTYTRKLITSSIVEPDLYNAELQNSYGVFTPEALLMKMVDNPAEYQNLMMKVQELNGFNITLEDMVEQAKN